MIEALSNAFEHAFIKEGDFRLVGKRAWLSGYVDSSQNEFMMMVFDHGSGIPRTVQPKLTERALAAMKLQFPMSDGSLIGAATDLDRTSTEQSGRGKGFLTMKRFVDACDDGELRVLSNRGQYIYSKTGVSIGPDRKGSLGGTLIQWRITHKAENIRELGDE